MGMWVWWAGGVPQRSQWFCWDECSNLCGLYSGGIVSQHVQGANLGGGMHVLRPDCPNPACRFRDDYLPTLRECGRLTIMGYHEFVACGSGVEEYFLCFH